MRSPTDSTLLPPFKVVSPATSCARGGFELSATHKRRQATATACHLTRPYCVALMTRRTPVVAPLPPTSIGWPPSAAIIVGVAGACSTLTGYTRRSLSVSDLGDDG